MCDIPEVIPPVWYRRSGRNCSGGCHRSTENQLPKRGPCCRHGVADRCVPVADCTCSKCRDYFIELTRTIWWTPKVRSLVKKTSKIPQDQGMAYRVPNADKSTWRISPSALRLTMDRKLTTSYEGTGTCKKKRKNDYINIYIDVGRKRRERQTEKCNRDVTIGLSGKKFYPSDNSTTNGYVPSVRFTECTVYRFIFHSYLDRESRRERPAVVRLASCHGEPAMKTHDLVIK